MILLTPNLDGEQQDLANSLAGPGTDADTCLRAFIVATGAAGCLAARFSDALDLGRGLEEDERELWAWQVSVLLRMGDRLRTDMDPALATSLADCCRLLAASLPEERESVQ